MPLNSVRLVNKKRNKHAYAHSRVRFYYEEVGRVSDASSTVADDSTMGAEIRFFSAATVHAYKARDTRSRTCRELHEILEKIRPTHHERE